MDDAMIESAESAPHSTDVVDSSATGVRVRKNFPETWLWQMLDAG